MTSKLRTFALIAAVSTAAALSAGCGERPRPASLRLVRLLDETAVLLSPLKDPRRTLPDYAGTALADRESGSNPWGLKRRLRVGNLDQEAVAAPPHSDFCFLVKVPRGSSLKLRFGIRRDDDLFLGKVDERRVSFQAVVEEDGASVPAFSREIVSKRPQSMSFGQKAVDLSRWAGRRVRLHLVTTGDPQALAFWFDPVLQSPRPGGINVVLISLDTLRADHLGCYGYPRPTSPALDALAAESAVFTSAIAPAPWTLPSHISLMTGLLPESHQVTQADRVLAPALTTMAETLRPLGLRQEAVTGGVLLVPSYGFNRGFDAFRTVGRIDSDRSARQAGREACRIIEDEGDGGLFLFIHTYQIHSPYYPPAEYAARFEERPDARRKFDVDGLGYHRTRRHAPLPDADRRDMIDLYDAEIRFTDDELIKPVVETLRRTGQYERTLLIVVSDHGEEFFEHGAWGHNRTMYQETLHVPLIVKPPGPSRPGRRVEAPAGLVDVLPTVAEALGMPAPKDLDGASLWPLIAGPGRPRPSRPLAASLAPRTLCVVRDGLKLILNKPFEPGYAEQFTPPPAPPEPIELFDLRTDPRELQNLAGRRPAVAREMLELLNGTVRPRVGATVRARMDEGLTKQLKALGYL